MRQVCRKILKTSCWWSMWRGLEGASLGKNPSARFNVPDLARRHVFLFYLFSIVDVTTLFLYFFLVDFVFAVFLVFLVFLVFVLIFGVFVFVVSVLLHRSWFWGSQVLSGPWAKHDNAWQSTTEIQHLWLTLSHSRAHLLDTRTKMELGNVVISAFERSL